MATRAAAPLAAYVLHHYDWSESSVILDLFTRDQGRVVAAAKGAKRPYSQLRAVLLPLQRVNVTLGRPPKGDDGSSEIHNLRAADYGGGAPMPGGAALFAGLYLNELLMKLLARHDPHPALFDAYAATLPALAASRDAPVQVALRAFELRLLREIGLLPELDVVTATQQPLRPGAAYTLHPDLGVADSGGQQGLAAPALVSLHAALEEGSIGALQAACADHLALLKPMLRGLLHYHLGSPRLRTRDVVIGVQKLLDKPT